MKPLKKIMMILILFGCLIPVYAESADRYVAESGSDASNDCTTSTSPCATIDHAVDQAVNGDTVKIAQGTYTEGVTLYSSINPLTIQGGWNEDFSNQSENPTLTIIDGGETERAVYIHIVSANLTLEDLTLKRGYSPNYGAGICASAQAQTISLTLENVILESNEGGNNGGAVYAHASQNGNMTLTVENCNIRENEANYGAGLDISATSGGTTTATIKNSFITDNGGSTSGGGFYVSSYNGNTEVGLINNTITNNTAPASLDWGGAVWVTAGSSSGETPYTSTVDSTNNIIWGNSGGDIFVQASGESNVAQVDSSYSDIGNVKESGNSGGMGEYNDNGNNINADPLLTGNYHLKATSPCIGTGVYAKRVWLGSIWAITYYDVPSEDFEGDSRNSDWIETEPGTEYKYCDIGADEYTPSFNSGILFLLFNN